MSDATREQATIDSAAPDQEADVLSPIGQAIAEAAAAGDTPQVKPVPRYDAVGIASQGRLTFSLTAFLTYMHSAQLAIPTTPAWGAYWDKAVHNAMEAAHEQRSPDGRRVAKYLLFYDGDGAWKRDDIEELYRIIEHETINGQPIDAVFPVQADRVHNIPLAYDWHHRVGLKDGPLDLVGPDGHYDYSGPLSRVLHGHHGLTFIRMSVLDDLPKPWLKSQAGEGGSYRTGTPNIIDPDTYFWLLMAEHDKVVVQANKVVIGHIDLHVRWQMGRRVFAQPLNAFLEEGSPTGMRCPRPAEYEGADPKGRLPSDLLIPPDMPGEPGQYRKLPIAVDAFQMTRERRESNAGWPDWLHEAWQKERGQPGSVFPADYGDGAAPIAIVTREGNHLVSMGDWIIRGVQGELYPCKPDIFAMTYEKVG